MIEDLTAQIAVNIADDGGPAAKRLKSQYQFCYKHLQDYLYNKHKSQNVHGIASTTPDRPPSTREAPGDDMPNMVQLSPSSIPGAGDGIQATQVIPIGAWIGPYKGKFIKLNNTRDIVDTSYSWEIFKDGQLFGFIDGSDENTSSWMRFIRCARHKNEQNLYAFQYLGKIYYRTHKTILPGQELLVWYDDLYTQYLGIPCQGIYDMASPKATSTFLGNVLVVTEEKELLTPPTTPTNTKGDMNINGKPALITGPVSPTNRSQEKTSDPKKTSREIIRDRLRKKRSSGLLNKQPNGFINKQPNGFRIKQTNGFRNKQTNGLINKQANGFLNKQTNGFTVDKTLRIPVTTEPFCVQNPTSSQSSNLTPSSPVVVEKDAPEQQMSYKSDQPQCGQCGMTFIQRGVLQTHVCAGVPVKPYQCGYCSESFANPGEMRVHVAIHQGKKPFKCGYCSRSFTGATTLNNHVRTHTSEKPFDCLACGKSFNKGFQLSKHQNNSEECVSYFGHNKWNN